MKRIFLSGYYGCGNVGDDLLLSVVTRQILAWSSEAHVIIKCLQVSPVDGGGRIRFETCETILADPALPRWKKAGMYSLRMWRALKGVSLFVFGGGTLFHAEKGSPVNLLLLLLIVCMARLRGARVLALGVGVSPITGLLPRFLMSALLLLSQDFAVRDASSFESCQALAGRKCVRQTADLVFLADFPKHPRKESGTRVLGLTLAASAIRQQGGTGNAVFQEIAGALNQLEKEGWTLRFLSFQELSIGGFQLSDSAILESLRNAGMSAVITPVEIGSKPERITEVFSDLDLVIGMRFHGLVLSALSGIPFLGIGSDHKLSDLCGKYGFPFFSFDELNAQQLLSAIHAIKEQIPDPQVTRGLMLAAGTNFSAFQNEATDERG